VRGERSGIGRRDTAPGSAKERGARNGFALQLERQLSPIEAKTQRGADAVIAVAVKVIDERRPGVVVRRRGHARHVRIAKMAVRVHEGRNHCHAAEVHDGRANRWAHGPPGAHLREPRAIDDEH
jgi:hypothetical protein